MLERFLEEVKSEFGFTFEKEEKPNTGTILHLKDTISITLNDLNPGLSYFSTLCKTPSEAKEKFFAYIMDGNFLGQGTGGAVIGLSPDEKSLTLSLAFPYEMEYGAFLEKLEDFAGYIDFWRDKIAKFDHNGI